ncbi:MAG TPA: hypothetical protein DIC42_02345 [Holosporales bacterium]|nr:hypothetical protein [Holosporales bacterium]
MLIKIMMIVFIGIISRIDAMETFSENVKQFVDFTNSESAVYDEPFEITLQQQKKKLAISFAKIYASARPEHIFIIANIRPHEEMSYCHERADFLEMQSIVYSGLKRNSMSKICFQDGEAFYNDHILLYLGHYNPFLIEDPFPRGLPPELVARLLMDPSRTSISTRH